MKKPVIAVVVALVVIVIVFLVLPYLSSSPCEKIFEQTSLTLGTKLDPITAKGEVLIGREKLQNLSDRSEMMAMTLKTCCIAHHEGKLSNDEFLSCNQSFKDVETDLAKAVTSLDEAAKAKQEGKVDVVNKKIEAINEIVTAVETRSEQFQEKVAALENRPVKPEPDTAGGEPVEGGYESVRFRADVKDSQLRVMVNGRTVGAYDQDVHVGLEGMLRHGAINTITFAFSSPAEGNAVQLQVLSPGSNNWQTVFLFKPSGGKLQDSFEVPFAGER